MEFLRELDSDSDLPTALRLETHQSEPIRTNPNRPSRATQLLPFKSKDSAVPTQSDIESQPEPHWKSRVDLLSLPNSQSTSTLSYPWLTLCEVVRHMIYDYLIFKDLIETREQRGVTTFLGLTNISRVSRTLRHEFLSYLLSTTKVHTTFKWLPRLIATFSELLHVCGSLVVLLFDPVETKEPVDLLPVLEIVLQIPLLSLRFQLSVSTSCCHPQATTIASDLNHLLQSCRTNKALNGQIRDRVLLSVAFHSDKYISHRYLNSNMNTRIQIRFKKRYTFF